MSFGKKIEQRSGSSSLGPQERIAYHGDLKPFLQAVSSNYDFGDYVSHEVKQNGYEDFNVVLNTTKNPVFIKCFNKDRQKGDPGRYLQLIENVRTVGGVRTPFLYLNSKGNSLTTVIIDGITVDLCAMQYLDGGNIWENETPLTLEEQIEAIRQAAKINSLDIDPGGEPDSWAILNIGQKYEENRNRLHPLEKPIMEKLIVELGTERESIQSLPQALVHGDIRSTNIMRNSDESIYVIDFSVARRYPRIMEMAILCCDILFNISNPQEFAQKYKWAISEYEKAGIKLTSEELRLLPLFVRLAHAANVVGASSIDTTNYISKKETEHWLNLGSVGLHYTVEGWGSNLH